MPPSDLTTSDILARLDAMEARSSAERSSIRAENRYLTGLLILVVAALAGVQVYFKGMSLASPTTQTVNVEQPVVAAPAAPAVPAAPAEVPAVPAGTDAAPLP